MSLLLVLWWSSLVMAAAALGWMIGLIAARLRRQRRDDARARDRARVRAACLAIIGGAPEAAAQLGSVKHRARLLAEALLEFGALVRGAERDRLIESYIVFAVDERLRARIFKGSRTGRLAAIDALAWFSSEATVKALRRVLAQTRDAELKAAAIRALVELDAPPEIGPLLRDLDRDQTADSLVYLPVFRRLIAGEPDAALIAFRDPDATPTARALLADGLAAAGDYRVLPQLVSAAGDSDPGVRTAVVRALGVLAHPAAIEPLRASLTDDDWEVRAAACEALSRIGAATVLDDVAARSCLVGALPVGRGPWQIGRGGSRSPASRCGRGG